jgi:hypothetical protein
MDDYGVYRDLQIETDDQRDEGLEYTYRNPK